MQRFVDKAVLVTGGSAGIGRATALAFAGEGAKVVVAGRSPESLGETVAAIEAAGGVGSSVVADVSSSEQVAAAVAATVERYGGLDVAFNNAGIVGSPGPVEELDEAVWNAVIATNLTGIWLAMKHEIACMKASGRGAIVNTASNVGAHLRRPNMTAYAASKAAVSALTRGAALECIGGGVRINSISPGAADTPMSRRAGETDEDRAARIATTIPIGRLGRTEEIAAAVLYLASDEAQFVVGHDLVLDGGASA